MSLYSLSEEQLIRWLFRDSQIYNNAFYFIEYAALGQSRMDWAIEVHLCVQREILGLRANQKPGDIDILFIPALHRKRFPEFSAAVEVKRFFIQNTKRGKSPNSYGRSQVNGLSIDGFPLISLLHISLIEPSHTKGWVDVQTLEPDMSPTNNNTQIDIEALSTSKRHQRRMENLDLPEFAGYNSVSLSVDATGNQVCGIFMGDYRLPSKNPLSSTNLIQRIREFTRTPDFIVTHSLNGITIEENKNRTHK